ncbi:hypothetical protein D5S18_30185 [Nocardia panacis]|uniref:Uncharacterized protein n=1 Tax=Nocardia panacis TaxID=2340916 RepID=A0A3A4K6J9_9NOCA|nr:hypothetical protein [Nocardia panacis]RJO70120.1 hypothetical protein D5S18_30185 [Nocardia panacis]
MEAVEEVVVERYHTLCLAEDFVAEARELLAEERLATKEMHANLNRRSKELNQKESRLVDLLADGSMPKAKVRMKLIEVKSRSARLDAGRLAHPKNSLSEPACCARALGRHAGMESGMEWPWGRGPVWGPWTKWLQEGGRWWGPRVE